MADYNSEAALQMLVAEKAAEDTYMEFKSEKIAGKAVDAAINDLAAEISAFANSAGGHLIIGVEESSEKDSASVAAELRGLKDPRWRSEWLAAKLEEKIYPPIERLSFSDVSLSEGGWCIVVTIPQSLRAPHQSADKKYYARRQYQKMAMAHYELEDVRNRRRVKRPEIRLSIFFSQKVFTEIMLENIGDSPVFNLKLHIPEEAKPALKIQAPALLNGISALNPGERLAFYVGSIQELFKHDVLKKDTLIEVFYEHEDGTAGRQFIVFNLLNHDHSSFLSSDVDYLRDSLSKQIGALAGKLGKVVDVLENTLGAIASPTGISISADTLTRLPGSKDVPRKWNAKSLTWQGFQEVLGCSQAVAVGLYSHFAFDHRRESSRLADLEGMTPELVKLFYERIEIPGEEIK